MRVARTRLHRIVKRFFKKQAPILAQQLARAYGQTLKADQDVIDRIMADLDMQGWAALAGEDSDLVGILQSVTQDGSHQALAQLGIDDQDITNLVDAYAQEYARSRGAELVGKKLIGGTFVDNPNAKWAITQGTRDMLRIDVQQAVDEGWSTQRLADVLENNYAFSDTRAEMISRTEIAFADVGGNMQAYRESGVVEGKKWLLSANPCDVCLDNADDGEIGLDDVFSSGDDAAPAHPNCFVSGTLVAAQGVTKHFKHRFRGEIVIMRVAGKDIRVTPNHPILTQRGWVAAQNIQRSDRLVQLLGWNSFIEHPDDDYIIAPIQQISDALRMTRGMTTVRMPATAEAFHGDVVVNTEIEIVRPDSYFSDEFESGAIQYSGDPSFSISQLMRIKFTILRTFYFLAHRVFSSARRIVSRFDALFSFGTTVIGGFKSASIALSSDGQVGAFETISQRRTMTTDALGEIARRFASKIAFVQLDDVIRKEFFDGHVYNLETRVGWYFADSIIAHNCECDTIPITIDLPEGD